MLKGKMSAILKRHCYHSNGDDVIFVNNFQLLEDCSIYVVQFLFSNKKPLFEKLNLNHDFVIFQKLQGATLSRKWCIFPCVIQINKKKLANFVGPYFPHFTTFRNQTLQFYSF